jgi:peptidoglycan/LPS O-acetylase OafA/YrhL
LLALPALGLLADGQIYHGSPTREPLLMYWHLFASVCVAALLLSVSSGRNFADGCLQSMALQWLGRISYGVYLWHYPVMVTLRESMGGMQQIKAEFAGFFFASLLISVTLAYLSWHWLEAPILRRVGSGTA